MKYIFPALVVLIALLIGPQTYTNWRTDKAIRQQISTSVGQLDSAGPVGANRIGHVRVDGVMRVFSEKRLHHLLSKEGHPPNRVSIWNWGGVSQVTASALGLDRKHHFANSYLVGYQPFEAKQIWVPLYTLAMRKRYEYDHLQYGGLQEVWQNSRQAYYYTRGDCEDHAIVLADWLIEMGVDARVVMGTHKKEGHAWVVFVLKGKTYLMEATSKRKVRSTGAIPAASVMVNYHPRYQFNRDSFWVNTGSHLTTNYTGPHWELKSRFISKKGRI